MTPETDADWWEGALEEDTTWSLPLEGEGGLWSSGFLPPPPRPAFLDDHVTPDGLTTCDLCTWARATALTSDSSSDLPGTVTWTVSLVLVSVLSALIGAALMVTLMHCRRSDDQLPRYSIFRCFRRRRTRDAESSHREPPLEGDKELVTLQAVGGSGGRGVWGWLSRRPLAVPPVPTVPAANLYTMEEAYAAVGEALYAELDRPAYQNTGYVSDADPASSAPSSAYYSDLSSGTGDRTYEAVGVTGVWDVTDNSLRRQPTTRLAAITETLSVPSDYV